MFWLEIGLVILTMFLLSSLINFILGKLLNIEKEKKELFSFDFANERHRKIDQWIRWGWMLVSILVIYLVLYRELPVTLYLMLFIAWMTTDASIRAYFQWKHSEQPKQAILTLSEMAVWVSTVTFIIYFDVFNFFT
ncbi:DUF4181 domain-containing protein [Planococcus citreus]|uniref:Uncharacterized protein DUF4181 n=1 Tax=Planococcus citreus TaxID=1373 RepID=A0A497YKN9_9BACL|nr:DUF4181 domain-containing protein [Planococcus citreus]RLJ91219.1 uncharacterized protein DUF4181 [Planococcus citreus]